VNMKYAVNPFAPRCRPCFPLIFAATLLQLKYSYPDSKVLTSALFPHFPGATVASWPFSLFPLPWRPMHAQFVAISRFDFPPTFTHPISLYRFSNVVVVVSARWCVLLSQIKRNHCCGTRFLRPISPNFPPFHRFSTHRRKPKQALHFSCLDFVRVAA